MQIIENLSLVDGCIMARRPSAQHDGWDDVTVLIERAQPVDHRAELMGQFVGSDVVISVPRELLDEAKPGDNISGHVSVAGPGHVLAAPQAVEGGRFDILPASE